MAGTPKNPGLAPSGTDCLGEKALQGVLDGLVEARDEDHLGTCAICQKHLQDLAGGEVEVELRAPDELSFSKSLQEAMADLKTGLLAEPPSLEEWLEPVNDEELLGRLGPYDIRQVFAEGGMGVVLEAYDPLLDREVAIKLIKPQRSGGKSIRERMLREARAVAAIEHESVVPIHAAEVLDKSGLLFIVMPLATGGNLQDLLDATNGPLPLNQITTIGKQVAAALAATHAQGILHRDIKPANILMRGKDKIWLADFGIACTDQDTRLTRAGELPGTPQYMSPEQVEGNECDARSDLFSLGAVLYQLATGSPAFVGDSSIATARAIADQTHSSLAKQNPDLPKWLIRIIDDLLAKSSSKRPKNATEVIARLTDGGENEPKKFYSRRGLLAVVVGLISLLGIWLICNRDPAPSPNSPAPSSAWADAKFTNARAAEGFTTLSEAITAAAPGDAIEIRVNGLVHDEPFPTVDKALILRAAAGFEPSFTSDDRKTSLIHNTAPLVLEGLRLRQLCESSEPPPVILAEASFHAVNCSIGRKSRLVRTRAEPLPGIVVAAGADRIDLLNCAIYSTASHALIVESGPCDLNLKNLVITTPTGIYFRHPLSESVRVHFERSSFHGRGFAGWDRRDDGRIAPVEFTMERSAIETTIGVFGAPTAVLNSVKSAVSFRGSENLYVPETRFLILSPSGGNKQISTLDDWLKFWDLGDEGSRYCPMDLRQRIMISWRGNRIVDLSLRPSAEATRLYPERGFDPGDGGLGESFERFRKTEAYRTWFKQAKMD